MTPVRFRSRLALTLLAALLLPLPAVSSAASAQQPAAPETPKDTLGRDTPRGMLIGFMTTARTGNFAAAALYLNTKLRDQAAAELAQHLYVVLNARLPARLQDISDSPEGGRPNPLKPDQDVVGSITTEDGTLDIVVERVNRGSLGSVWLFAPYTLEQIPAVYDQVHVVSIDQYLPGFLTRFRIGGIRLFDWIALFLALPLLYYAFALAMRPLGSRFPGALRVIAIAIVIRWLSRRLDLPLIERQFWASITAMLFVGAVVWLCVTLVRAGERYLLRRIDAAAFGDTTSILRLGRTTIDGLVILIGILAVLRYFGVDATAALAGLGIGGIAIALAAQKTLENVVGGLSIIFDRAVKVGDVLNVGGTVGTVEYVGLRSTRIRTLDRTLLRVPNGQIATINIETLSARDKFWFRHDIRLAYDTSAAQMRAIIGDVRALLLRHTRVDDSAVRVSFVRLSPSSIDVEVVAYLFAQNWSNFCEMQEALLLEVMEIVERHGAAIALPTQTIRVATPEGRVLS